MKKTKQSKQAAFFFIVMVAISSLALYDGDAQASKDDNILVRASSSIIHKAGETVDKSMKLFISDKKVMGEALAHYKTTYPEKAELVIALEQEGIEACPPVPQVQLYCMSYDYQSKEMDAASLNHAEYIKRQRPESEMKGCFQKNYTFRLCLIEVDQTQTENL